MEATKSSPKDAQVMAAILKDMGVTDHEPRVINHMLEFTYRYVTDVLDDAKVYSSHAGKKALDVDDVKLAIQCKLDHSFTTPPPKDLLMDVAKHKNNNPLPVIKPFTGPKLPSDRYCLSSSNYRLRSLKKPKPQTGPQIIPTMQAAPRIITQTSNPSSMSKVPLQMVHKGPTSMAGQMMTVKPSLHSVTTPSATVPTPMFKINTVPGIPSTNPAELLGGIKRKREEDDYDIS